MQKTTQPHNDFEELSKLLPGFNRDLEMFEFLACSDLDGGYFNTLGLADFKLHYPEPFIASPSFVHEEV